MNVAPAARAVLDAFLVAEEAAAASGQPAPDFAELAEVHREHERELWALFTADRRARAALVPGDESAAAPRFGDRIGRWRVVGALAETEQSLVYEAERLAGGERAVLKLPQVDAPIERILREAAAIRRLAHDGIVRLLEIAWRGARPVLVLERITGRTLRERLAAGPLALPEALEVVARICDAVAHAHGKGVLHRDLKPGNVMLDGAGAVRLLDFGLAWVDGHSTLTRAGETFGTPEYMAPETLDPASARFSPASDVYAIGCILYRCVLGCVPHDAPAPGLLVGRRLALRPPRAPRALDPSLPRGLEAVLQEALAPRERDRIASAAELAAELRRLEGGTAPRAELRRRARAVQRSTAIGVLLAVIGYAGVEVARDRAPRAAEAPWNPTAERLREPGDLLVELRAGGTPGLRAAWALGEIAGNAPAPDALDPALAGALLTAVEGAEPVELPVLLGAIEKCARRGLYGGEHRDRAAAIVAARLPAGAGADLRAARQPFRVLCALDAERAAIELTRYAGALSDAELAALLANPTWCADPLLRALPALVERWTATALARGSASDLVLVASARAFQRLPAPPELLDALVAAWSATLQNSNVDGAERAEVQRDLAQALGLLGVAGVERCDPERIEAARELLARAVDTADPGNEFVAAEAACARARLGDAGALAALEADCVSLGDGWSLAWPPWLALARARQDRGAFELRCGALHPFDPVALRDPLAQEWLAVLRERAGERRDLFVAAGGGTAALALHHGPRGPYLAAGGAALQSLPRATVARASVLMGRSAALLLPEAGSLAIRLEPARAARAVLRLEHVAAADPEFPGGAYCEVVIRERREQEARERARYVVTARGRTPHVVDLGAFAARPVVLEIAVDRGPSTYRIERLELLLAP